MKSWFDDKPMPAPSTPEEMSQHHPRRWYCPHCKREIIVNINMVPINVDGRINYSVAGFSVPNLCMWCGEPQIREMALEEAPQQPIQRGQRRQSGLLVPQ